MRRRIEALADSFEEFVSEDEHDALVIVCDSASVGLVAAAVDLREQRGSLDISFHFTEHFVDARAAIGVISSRVVAFAARVAAPAKAASSSRELVESLNELAVWARRRGDVRCALWLVPSSVDDIVAYAEMAAALARATRATDGRVRVAVRDPDGTLISALRRDGIRSLSVGADLSARAFRDALAEEADDPALPIDERMAAAMTVAMTDAGNGEGAGALETLETVRSHFAARGLRAHEAIATTFEAHVHGLEGRPVHARARAITAVLVALRAGSAPALVSAATSAGVLAVQDRDPAAAEPLFRLALAAACGARALPIAIDIGVRLGDVLAALSRIEEAHQAWLEALALVVLSGMNDLARAPSERLRSLYEETGHAAEARAMADVIEAIGPHGGCTHGAHL